MRSNASFTEAVSVAAGSLRSSKLRSFLTLLGIILATTTLIAVMAVIEGMNRYIAERITEDMGGNSFVVRRAVMIGQWDPKKWLEMQRRNPELNRTEYEFLKSKVTLAREVGIEASRRAVLRREGKRMEQVEVMGASSNVALISNFESADGRFFLDLEDQRRMPVAFIGNDVRDRLFPAGTPIGKTLDIDGRRFEVRGVGKAKGSVFGESLDNYVVIPAETFFKVYGARRDISYHILALDHQHVSRAQDEVRMLLRAYRHLGPKQDDNFGMFSPDSILTVWENMTRAIAATAIAIVSVFMVVGGVVIMNIMLAVVTERTHEIGIRKSVGARNGDILRQFLVEASLLAATGGAIGVLVAWAVAIAVRNFTPVPMSLPYSAVFVGVTLSAAVGLFFGIYPARRASRLDPIEALRMEL